MSNYYSYHCLDCDAAETPANVNHRHEQFLAVLRHKEAIVALKPLSEEQAVWDFDISVASDHSAPIEFLAEHLKHHLVVMSEYSDHYYEMDGTRVDLGFN